MFNISAHKPPPRAIHLREHVKGNSGLCSSSAFLTNSSFADHRRGNIIHDRSAVLFRKLKEDLEILVPQDKQQNQKKLKIKLKTKLDIQ